MHIFQQSANLATSTRKSGEPISPGNPGRSITLTETQRTKLQFVIS